MALTKTKLSNPKRLEDLLKEAERELKNIQPRIDELETSASELKELRSTKQRLITLKMSLSTLLESITKDEVNAQKESNSYENSSIYETKLCSLKELSASKTFDPNKALNEIEKILKQKASLNYEMFKAVVFNGGKANTEEIKAYLIENGITQPQTGEDFTKVPLTEISSRANYLVRKGVLQPLERGSFFTHLGWLDPSIN